MGEAAAAAQPLSPYVAQAATAAAICSAFAVFTLRLSLALLFHRLFELEHPGGVLGKLMPPWTFHQALLSACLAQAIVLTGYALGKSLFVVWGDEMSIRFRMRVLALSFVSNSEVVLREVTTRLNRQRLPAAAADANTDEDKEVSDLTGLASPEGLMTLGGERVRAYFHISHFPRLESKTRLALVIIALVVLEYRLGLVTLGVLVASLCMQAVLNHFFIQPKVQYLQSLVVGWVARLLDLHAGRETVKLSNMRQTEFRSLRQRAGAFHTEARPLARLVAVRIGLNLFVLGVAVILPYVLMRDAIGVAQDRVFTFFLFLTLLAEAHLSMDNYDDNAPLFHDYVAVRTILEEWEAAVLEHSLQKAQGKEEGGGGGGGGDSSTSDGQSRLSSLREHRSLRRQRFSDLAGLSATEEMIGDDNDSNDGDDSTAPETMARGPSWRRFSRGMPGRRNQRRSSLTLVELHNIIGGQPTSRKASGLLQTARSSLHEQEEGQAAGGAAEEQADGSVSPRAAASSPSVVNLGASRGALVVDRVSLAFAGRTVLDGLSLRVPQGMTVGIVGETGCGKSTLLRCITGLQFPDAGRVRVGSTDIYASSAQTAAWFDSICVIPQHAYLFQMSVRDNLTYGMRGDVAQADIERAAQQALAHEFIMQLPQGYNTVLVGGNQLSGGQRQRLYLARAFLKRSRFLFLDEPTSALDNDTQDVVITNLRSLLALAGGHSGGRLTSIIITHRVEVLVLCDKVYKLAGGTLHPVAADGSTHRATQADVDSNIDAAFRQGSTVAHTTDV